jgi:uncharacterized protein (DUF433 family)
MVYRLNFESADRELLKRVTFDPNICHGKPCIRGMRWPVEVLLGLLSSGMTYQEILDDHEGIELEDIHAAINYNSNYHLTLL